MIDFDLMLVHVGEFGLYQKILFFFQAPFCIFNAFLLFGQLFIYIYPREFWCQEHPCFRFDDPISNLTRSQRRNISIPYNFRDRVFDPCNTYDVTASQIEAMILRARKSCRAIDLCVRNRSQICDYSVIRDTCTPRTFTLSRKKRQTYSERGPVYGRPQYDPTYENGNWNNPWGKPTDAPTGGSDSNFNFETTRPSNFGTTRSPVTVRPPTPTTKGRTGTTLETTTRRPVSERRTTVQGVCDDIRVDRYTISRQDNFTSVVIYNVTVNGTDNNNRVTTTTTTNHNKTVNRIIVTLPNNTFIDVENLTNFVDQARARWGIVPCRNWTFQRRDLSYPTIVTELNWWCDAETRIIFANAMFYVGAIVGGIVIGYIADMGGRMPGLVTANILGCIGGCLSAIFYQNFWLFCFFRFICGMAFDNAFMMIYIIALEYVGPTYRTLVANLSIAIFYTLGTLILPGLALLIGNWRIFMLAISLPMLLAIIGIFVVPESARWLLSKGKTKKATQILRRFAKLNGKTVPENIFTEFEADATKLHEELSKEKDPTLMEAFRKPRILKNFIFLCLIWPIISLVYDGHSRNILNLGENIFLSFTIASSTEFPADMFLIFTLDRLGRRWMAFGSLCACGGFSLAAAFVPTSMATMSLVMALLARFCINVSLNTGLQFASELLPTVIRAQGTSIIHIMGFVASIIAPFIASIGRTNPALSLTLLGTIALIGGVLSLFLPETLGEDLPNTLEDGEVFGKNQSFWNCPICAKPKPETEVKPELTPVQLRNNMRASLRGESFRSSIISNSSKRSTPSDRMMMNPMGEPTETTRLRRQTK